MGRGGVLLRREGGGGDSQRGRTCSGGRPGSLGDRLETADAGTKVPAQTGRGARAFVPRGGTAPKGQRLGPASLGVVLQPAGPWAPSVVLPSRHPEAQHHSSQAERRNRGHEATALLAVSGLRSEDVRPRPCEPPAPQGSSPVPRA